MLKAIWETIKANHKSIITKTLVGAGVLIGGALLANQLTEDEDECELFDEGCDAEEADDESDTEEK